MSENPQYLIVGLGNPGRQYQYNRHNIGFRVLDHLAIRLNTQFSRVEAKALIAKTEYLGKRVILAKPQTYMNLSGQATGSLLRFYKIPHERLLVVYDDIDLPLGIIRLRAGGSSAGQKGMQSILEILNNQEFPRLRLGINRPSGKLNAADYVLQDFSEAEADSLSDALDRAVEAALVFISDGIVKTMNQFNTAPTE